MKQFKVVIQYSIALLFLFGLLWLSLNRLDVNLDFFAVFEYKTRILQGFMMTIQVSVCALLLSLVIGIVAALGVRSKIGVIRALFHIYIQFIRGTPLIMQIYLFFYIVGTAWGIDSRFVAGVIILSVFEGAYIAEILRGGFNSIDNSQLEVAKAVGFNQRQTLRFVILPQLINQVLPALTGQFASIIKDSSLLSMISVIELMQTVREISAVNFKLFESYFILGILYLCLTLPISLLTKKLERKFSYET